MQNFGGCFVVAVNVDVAAVVVGSTAPFAMKVIILFIKQ